MLPRAGQSSGARARGDDVGAGVSPPGGGPLGAPLLQLTARETGESVRQGVEGGVEAIQAQVAHQAGPCSASGRLDMAEVAPFMFQVEPPGRQGGSEPGSHRGGCGGMPLVERVKGGVVLPSTGLQTSQVPQMSSMISSQAQ